MIAVRAERLRRTDGLPIGLNADPELPNPTVYLPAFRPDFRIRTVAPDGLFLISEGQERALHGRHFVLLAPLIDGTRPIDDIIDALASQADAAELYFAYEHLRKSGLLVDARKPRDTSAVYWSALGRDAGLAQGALAHTRVRVCAFGVSGAPMAEALAALGFGGLGGSGAVSQTGGAPETSDASDGNHSIDVVLVDDYLRPELADFNIRAVAAGRSWMLVKPNGTQAWVGPLFKPGHTGCWACLAQRLKAHRRLSAFIERQGRARANEPGRGEATEPCRAPLGELPSSAALAFNLAATRLAHHVIGHDDPSPATLLAFDFATLATSRHELTRRPQCTVCGNPATRDAACAEEAPALVLAAQKKIGGMDGRHGSVPPAQTLARYERHVSPISGAVSGLLTLPSQGPLHVVMAGHNFAFPAQDMRALRHGLRSMSSGKGASEEQARAGALCEALERYSGLFQGDEPRRRARLAELGADAVHPASCLLFSDRQYEQRAAWNASDSHFARVPYPFDEDEAIDWSPVWSLSEQRTKYVATAYCYYGYPAPRPEARFCWGDSNGSAAGNTREEALLQGLLELVERDAVALWWYNRLPRPGVELERFELPFLAALRRQQAREGRMVWALDLTSDLGIPVFVALSRHVDGSAQRILFGFGAHLDPSVALTRAFAEMNQCLRRALSGGVDEAGSERFADAVFRDWWREATLASHPYLLPDASRAPIGNDGGPSQSDDLREDIDTCRRLLEARGLELMVLEQTRADIGLPVLKVIVPGLRHFWPRFAPGRLYDVPVAMGELASALEESALNPVPMFL